VYGKLSCSLTKAALPMRYPAAAAAANIFSESRE
jgi:hypothetical protein